MRKVICAVHVYINLVCVNRRGVGEGGEMVCGWLVAVMMSPWGQ